MFVVAALSFGASGAHAQAQAGTTAGKRIVITPAVQAVVAGDSLRLRAQVVDAAGKPIPGVTVMFRPAGYPFEGSVDSTGLVLSGAVGTLPVAAVALVPGEKPIIHRFEVAMVAGPAARIDVAPRPTRMLPGQRMLLGASVFSKANDVRADRVEWSSSSPGVVKVSPDGSVQALLAGKATITATAGAASEKIPVEVVAGRVASVEVQPARTTARTGDVVHFRAVVKDAAGKEITGLTPSWLFTPGKGMVDPDGSFVAYEPGSYQVTASFGSQTADAVVTATDRDVKRPVKVVGKLLRTAFPTGELWIHPNGNVAYLTTELGGDRVYTVDISNPGSPVVVDSVILNARGVNDVMTTPDGNYAVMTREGASDRKNGIVIFDTRNPLHPKQVSEFTDGVTSGVHSTFIHSQPKWGTHIYLTNDGTGALNIIDIADPAHPKQVGSWAPRQSEAGRMLHDIDVQDGLLYGSWWNDGLVILDVGNGIKGGSPSNPKLVSQFKYDLNSLYRDVEKEGGKGFIRGTHTAWRYRNYVLIADEVFGNDAAQQLFSGNNARAHGRLQVVDVTNVEHPKAVAWYEPEFGGVHNVWVAGDTLYMGAYNAGFHAFDLSGELRGDLKAQGREIGEFMTGDPKGHIPNAPMAWGVVVNKKDGLAYVNDVNSGLWALRIEPKSKPVP
jgi:hypothetical protein